jgi:hypothetical protein
MVGQLGLQTAFQNRFEHLGEKPARPGQAYPVGAHTRHKLIQHLVIQHRADQAGRVTGRSVPCGQRQPNRRGRSLGIGLFDSITDRQRRGRSHRIGHRALLVCVTGFNRS